MGATCGIEGKNDRLKSGCTQAEQNGDEQSRFRLRQRLRDNSG